MNFATIKRQFSTPAAFAADLKKRAQYYTELYYEDEDSSDEDIKYDNIAMQLLFDDSNEDDIDAYIRVAYDHCKEFYYRDSDARTYFWEKVRDADDYVTKRLVRGGYMKKYLADLKEDEHPGYAMLILSALANAGVTEYFTNGTFIKIFNYYKIGFEDAFYNLSPSALRLIKKYSPQLIKKFVDSWESGVNSELGLTKAFLSMTEAELFEELASLEVRMVGTNATGSFLELNERLVTTGNFDRENPVKIPLKKEIIRKLQDAVELNKIYFGRLAVSVEHIERLIKNKKDIVLAKIYTRTVHTGRYNLLFKPVNIKVRDIFTTNRDDEFAHEKLSLQEYFANVADTDIYNLVADDYEKVDTCIDDIFKHFNIKRQKIYEFLSQ